MAKSIEDQLLELACDRLYNLYAPHSEPEIHVVSRSATQWRVVISKYDYCYAQSGSDWATHHIMYGTVTVDGDHVVSHDLQVHNELMSEYDSDRYNSNDVVKEFIKKVADS